MKNITIFFDFEGVWGMPQKTKYDIEKTLAKIMAILGKYKIKAVFNTAAVIFSKYPVVVKDILREGHEISWHGYRHENLLSLNLTEIKSIINKSENEFKKISERKMTGLRMPYLLGPLFYRKEVYRYFYERGYIWTSNREIRFVEEIYTPDRVKNSLIPKILHRSKLDKNHFINQCFYYLINFKLLLTENINVLSNKSPYQKNGLIEIPLSSFLDCDVLGLPDPAVNSDPRLLDYFFNSLVDLFNESQSFFNINFHDWIIGSANRINILDKILNYLTKQTKVRFITGTEVASTILKKHE